MITKTFITKSNTIFRRHLENFGLNPICMLNHGRLLSRFLIYFDESKIKSMYEDGTYPDLAKFRHIIRMKNCGSIDPKRFDEMVPSKDSKGIKMRTSSFDLIAFRIPNVWDEGTGFDNSTDFWFLGKNAVSFEGSNWYQYRNSLNWNYEGIYTNDFLTKEYEKFGNGEESVIVASQHFEHGNEDIALDVTDFVNSLILDTDSAETEYFFTHEGEEKSVLKHTGNCGLCIAFSPLTEEEDTELTKYVGFFGNNTNTIFEPYLESTYDDRISDDRYKFYLGKENRLYLYVNIGGELENLDEIPTCTIDGNQYEVTMQSKGIYYATVKLDTADGYDKDMILYDVWSNLSFQGSQVDDVEMEFVVKGRNGFLRIGELPEKAGGISVTLTGINSNEKVYQDDKRVVRCTFNRKYSKSEYELLDKSEYRMYVKDGKREIDMIPWQPVDTVCMENIFTIDCSEYLPAEYHIDIRARRNNEVLNFKDSLIFTIINDATKEKR